MATGELRAFPPAGAPDAATAERLDRLWDAVVRGRSPAVFGADADLAREMRGLHALDTGPIPDPTFLRRLEEELMGLTPASTTRVVPLNARSAGLASARSPVSGSPRRSRPASLWGRLGTGVAVASVLLLTLVTSLTTSRLAAPRPDERTARPAVQAATPSPEATRTGSVRVVGDGINVSECTARARPAGTLERLVGTSPTTTTVLPLVDPVLGVPRAPASPAAAAERQGVPPPPPGILLEDLVAGLEGYPAAGGEALSGITAAVRQLTACRFYRGPGTETDEAGSGFGRLTGLCSDDYFRRRLSVLQAAGVELALDTPPPRISSLPYAVTRTWTLPDGRVAAVLAPASESGRYREVVVFVRDAAGWLIDEHQSALVSRDAFSIRAAVPFQAFDLAVADGRLRGGMMTGPGSSEPRFYAGVDLRIGLANLGRGEFRFAIAALGVDVVVPAGESVDIVVNAPEGTYPLPVLTFQDGTPISLTHLTFAPRATPSPQG